ncbi:tripartite tricarboxylate transporter permease [Salinicoccus halodurans]|uniref:C4-dicarboxylate ABC transporter permease n=1 Tax=Salinicoccus halodurans TaxID=407035 RepID=A0A0F7HPC6_9STAP|nr:tripartite tricarboxylate transporter permease [Salinicoccus halodurans]AKG75007.1 C4-dicarboxylate ABC transporter permease [Salinicoccus halodurans]SFK67005.1 putative tricarboxylic transport membrane protein [Salinicoccus halodurans]
MDVLMEGFSNTLTFNTILFIFLGVISGIAIGVLPGLTATMGVALLLPITFGMEPLPGILLLIGVYFGAVYGGTITAILINTPGTPASAATALDGYPMTQKGEARKALTIATLSTSIGGIISVIVLILLAPQLANFALQFSAPETFALALFGITIISSLTGKSFAKGIVAGLVGLLIATIGLDPIGGTQRFTFGSMNLNNGVNLIPVMIGLFAAAEAFRSVEKLFSKDKIEVAIKKTKLKWSEFKSLITTILRSAGIGTFVGMIPGSGADITAFIAYNEAKRFSKDKSKFGKGEMKGIAAPEAANSSLTGGAMIPMLTLGIPGDAVTAVLLGALIVQGLQPGPMLFEQDGVLVYGLFIGMLIANLLILILGIYGTRFFTKVLLIPKAILVPVIIMLCAVGSYSLGNNYFDVIVMLVFGIIGYFMIKNDFPASPLILGLILGPIMESNFRRALVMSQGDFSIFITRPITAVLLIFAFITLFSPLIIKLIKKKYRKI